MMQRYMKSGNLFDRSPHLSTRTPHTLMRLRSYTISRFKYSSAKQSSAACQNAEKPQDILSATLIVQLKMCWIGPILLWLLLKCEK